MPQVHIFVSGRVQGVGYRKFVQYQARKLGLAGWVQNLPDRRVEAVIQGPKEGIQKLLARCRRGPFLAEVSEIQEAWQEAEEKYDAFVIHKPR